MTSEQIPVLTLTLNPALDMATAVPHLVPDQKLRCSEPQLDPGGGGLNVSRAIAALGGESLALVALGYLFGAAYGQISNGIYWASLAAVATVALALLARKSLMRRCL